MLKPLSQKTIEKKYAQLGLPQEKIDLLHSYFRCFCNLYGIIMVRDAWDVFKTYEGTAVHKKDFIAFSDIVQREGGHPYSVYEMKEIYCDENTTNPLDRMIVNKLLVLSGHNKFIYIYPTVDHQVEKPYYTPDKKTFLKFTEDRFYLTNCGKNMKMFIENLVTDGVRKDYSGRPNGKITDIEGNSVKGKRLSECIFYTYGEEYEIGCCKTETQKQKLLDKINIPASEKILKRIQKYIMTGGFIKNNSPAQEIRFLIDSLDEDFGVGISKKQFEKFTELFKKLNNNSNLWLNCGWSPHELFRKSQESQFPTSISIGPNMKKMFASGEMDKEDFEKKLAEMGISLIDNS